MWTWGWNKNCPGSCLPELVMLCGFFFSHWVEGFGAVTDWSCCSCQLWPLLPLGLPVWSPSAGVGKSPSPGRWFLLNPTDLLGAVGILGPGSALRICCRCLCGCSNALDYQGRLKAAVIKPFWQCFPASNSCLPALLPVGAGAPLWMAVLWTGSGSWAELKIALARQVNCIATVFRVGRGWRNQELTPKNPYQASLSRVQQL